MAVRELSGQREAFERAFSVSRLVSCLSRPFLSAFFVIDLIYYEPRRRRVFLEEFLELVRYYVVYERPYLGVAELRLGLAFKLRVGQLYGYNGDKTGADVGTVENVAVENEAAPEI